MFFIKQDVKVLFGSKKYQLHKNDVKNVHMWVQQNTNLCFIIKKLGNWGRGGWWFHQAKHAFYSMYPNTMAKRDDD